MLARSGMDFSRQSWHALANQCQQTEKQDIWTQIKCIETCLQVVNEGPEFVSVSDVLPLLGLSLA